MGISIHPSKPYMSTTMRNVQLNIQFNYDIQHTNYEILQ